MITLIRHAFLTRKYGGSSPKIVEMMKRKIPGSPERAKTTAQRKIRTMTESIL